MSHTRATRIHRRRLPLTLVTSVFSRSFSLSFFQEIRIPRAKRSHPEAHQRGRHTRVCERGRQGKEDVGERSSSRHPLAHAAPLATRRRRRHQPRDAAVRDQMRYDIPGDSWSLFPDVEVVSREKERESDSQKNFWENESTHRDGERQSHAGHDDRHDHQEQMQ